VRDGPLVAPPLPPSPFPDAPAIAAPPPSFRADQAPLARLEHTLAAFPGQSQFSACAHLIYDPAAHGDLNTLLQQLAPYSIVQIPPGQYQVQLQIQQPVYLRGEGEVMLFSGGAGEAVLSVAEFVVIEGITIAQVETQYAGALAVCGGFTSLLNCQISSPCLSAVMVYGDGVAEFFGGTICNSYNPLLHALDNAHVRCVGTQLLNGKTYGALVSGAATASFFGCVIQQNGAAGVVAQEGASVSIANDTQIASNGAAACQFASTGLLVVEQTAIGEHPAGAGVVASGAAAVRVAGCRIAGCAHGALLADSNGLISSEGGDYADSGATPIVCAQGGGILFSKGDALHGQAAAVGGARLELADAKIDAAAGAAVVAYNGARVAIAGGEVAGATYGVHARDGALLELDAATITGGSRAALFAGAGVAGSIRGCQFRAPAAAAAEFLGCGALAVADATFGAAATAGAIVRASIRFEQCVFADSKGVGAEISAAAVFERCEFRGNAVAGVRAQAGGDARFVGGSTSASPIGLLVSGGRAVADGLELSGCAEAGLLVAAEGSAVLRAARVKDNARFGAQVSGKGATLRLIDSTVTSNGKTGVVAAGGVAQCEGCTFEGDASLQAGVLKDGTIYLGKCEIAGRGIALQATAGGVLLLDEGTVKGARFGIVAGDGGVVKGAKATVKECTAGGFFAQAGANADFDACVFERNGPVGLQLKGGKALLLDCELAGHSAYGAYVESAAEFAEFDSKFSGNGRTDVCRA
jgi:hypothetical protein